MKVSQKALLFISVLFLLTIFSPYSVPGSVVSAASDTPQDIIADTVEALRDMDTSLDSSVFRRVLRRAQGVAIFPSVTEIALLGVGGMSGNGLVLRKDRDTGVWYGPAFLKISTLGVGARVGIQNLDLLLVINDSDGLGAFMKKTFKFGGTLAWTVGPIGRSVSAEIDSELTAPIYSYSIAKGLYFDAGSLEGSTIKDHSSANRAFWGEEISNKIILEERRVINTEVMKICNYIDNMGTD